MTYLKHQKLVAKVLFVGSLFLANNTVTYAEARSKNDECTELNSELKKANQIKCDPARYMSQSSESYWWW